MVTRMIERLNILVAHATLDAFNGMVLLATGAVTMDVPVNIFLTHDAVFVLKKENLEKPLEPETKFPEVKEAYKNGLESGKIKPWYELLREIKEMGDIRVIACGLAADLFGVTEDDLPDFVDGIAGVADFVGGAGENDLTITF